jgi:hypothetical protein
LQALDLIVLGNVQVWIEGQSVEVQKLGRRPEDQARLYQAELGQPLKRMSTVAMRVEPFPGNLAGAVFPEPVRLHCGKGEITVGDWSKMGVLEYYSGGMWYRRRLSLLPRHISGRTILDLGQVVATCEVHVNGKPAGILLNEPFQLDLTSLLHPGENILEVLVYSTLSNHYQTTPTPYKGKPIAGLIGPVQLQFRDQTTSQ